MAIINIKDIDKISLLENLWYETKVITPLGYMNMEFDKASALKDAERLNWNFDYLQGRLIRSNISGDIVNTVGFDYDNGNGAFEDCVNNVRKQIK